MSELLRRPGRATEAPGFRPFSEVSATSEDLKYVTFHVVQIAPGASTGFDTRGQELCLVVLEGECDVRAYVRGRGGWGPLGGRRDPFDGPPVGYYASAPAKVFIRSARGAEIAVGLATADPGPPTRPLPASGARREVRGSGAIERTIHHILMEDQPASSLLVTEVVTPAGHWSSYPPHKHDTDDPPRESKLEEIYYFRFRDPRGFGLMRVYTDDRSLDDSIAVRDGDLVLVPRGYHTVSAPPGYELYYLNVMAGPLRAWKVTFDPDHQHP